MNQAVEDIDVANGLQKRVLQRGVAVGFLPLYRCGVDFLKRFCFSLSLL
jgi:hypothetical protein